MKEFNARVIVIEDDHVRIVPNDATSTLRWDDYCIIVPNGNSVEWRNSYLEDRSDIYIGTEVIVREDGTWTSARTHKNVSMWARLVGRKSVTPYCLGVSPCDTQPEK